MRVLRDIGRDRQNDPNILSLLHSPPEAKRKIHFTFTRTVTSHEVVTFTFTLEASHLKPSLHRESGSKVK